VTRIHTASGHERQQTTERKDQHTNTHPSGRSGGWQRLKSKVHDLTGAVA
jgi:hypothetical protein